MRIIIKNGTMEFKTAEAYPVQQQVIYDQMQSWFELLTPAVSGQVFKVKIVSIGGATWSSQNAVVGFTTNSTTAPSDTDRQRIDKDNVGTEYQITLAADFGYWYVYLPVDLRNHNVTVEIQRVS